MIVTGIARAEAGKNMNIAKAIKILFTFVSSFQSSCDPNLF